MNKGIFLVLAVLFAVIAAFTMIPRNYYSDNHPLINEIRKRLALLSPEYASIPMRIGKRSFTEDKSVITLCIEDPKTGKLYDINTLMYVSLHELAHVVTKADGDESHADEFKGNFSKLLKEAARKRIYDPRQPIPTD